MGQRDNANDVQNRFTAYLLTAVKRKKRDYLGKRFSIDEHELLTDFQETQYPDQRTSGLPDWPRYAPQAEGIALMQALSRLTEKERRILFERVLDDVEYDELANGLGLRYSGAASAYYRIVQKLKRALKEGQE